MVGAPYDGGGSTLPGTAYVIYGPFAGGAYFLPDADALLVGENVDDQAGYSVAFAGDLNSDGVDDLLIGAPSYSSFSINAGAVYVVYGGNP